MNNQPRLDELAALNALDLIDPAEHAELRAAMERDPGVRALVEDYAEITAQLAVVLPQKAPPRELRQAIMDQLPHATRSRIVSVAFTTWLPYAIAACLMILAIGQAHRLANLKSELAEAQAEASRLKHDNSLLGLRVATLEAKDASYMNAKVVVAWDPLQHKGVISIQNLPPPAPGHDYQLWVLDPGVKAPISAGLVSSSANSQPFAVQAAGNASNPGFAISLEPAGGRPQPTGAILFAVASSP
jgi:anti-sigma-K factor RskA